jgi:hypothetical protein
MRKKKLNNQASPMVMLLTGGLLVRILAWTLAIMTVIFRGLPHSLRANSGRIPQLGHGHFPSNNFQSIHKSSVYMTLCSPNTDCVVNNRLPPPQIELA